MAGDWIRLHRKTLESRVFSDPWLLQLWVWCLLRAGWKPCWKLGCEIPAGGFATTYRQAAEQLNTTTRRIHRGLHLLQEWGQIRLKAERAFSVITLCNWEVYQCGTDPERNASVTPAERQRNASVTPSLVEEGKEGKEAPPRVRATFVPPSLEEVAAYCRERGNTVDPAAWLAHYESNGWRVGRTPMKDWRAAVRTWERNAGHFGNGKAQKPLAPREATADNVARIARERAEALASTAPPDRLRAILGGKRE